MPPEPVDSVEHANPCLSVSPGPSGLPEGPGPLRASLFSLKSAGFKALC